MGQTIQQRQLAVLARCVAASDAHKRFLLAEARHYQIHYWQALSQLEKALGVEIDSSCDLENQTVESLLSD